MWFMSYAQVLKNGDMVYGHHSYPEDTHPLLKTQAWNEKYGKSEGFTIILLFFQKMTGDESCVLTTDVTSPVINNQKPRIGVPSDCSKPYLPGT